MKKIIACLLTLSLVMALAMGTAVTGYAVDEIKGEAEVKTKAETGAETGAEQEPKQEPETETEQEPKPEPETETEQEPKPEPEPIKPKIDISAYTVELNKYMVMATGEPITPKVTKVSSGSKKTLKKANYEVVYYKVINFSKEKYERVDEIRKVGEYKVAVVGKGAYGGETFALFTVMGKQQHLTLAKVKYELKMGAEAITLKPKTDGDGTGFAFRNLNPDVIELSKKGRVRILKAGRAVVKVSTRGEKLYRRAGVTVVFEISPSKVSWNKNEMAAVNEKEKSKVQVVWNKVKGATNYEIEYSTNSKFQKPKGVNKSEDYEKKVVRVSSSKKRITLENLSKDKTYYVRIRALTKITDERGNKKTLEGSWSKTLKIEKNGELR